jgi:hypothetical protein
MTELIEEFEFAPVTLRNQDEALRIVQGGLDPNQ